MFLLVSFMEFVHYRQLYFISFVAGQKIYFDDVYSSGRLDMARVMRSKAVVYGHRI